MYSAGSDRILVIVPKQAFDQTTISYLVEIISLTRPQNDLVSNNQLNNFEENNNALQLIIKGLKRFKLTSAGLRNIIENIVKTIKI